MSGHSTLLTLLVALRHPRIYFLSLSILSPDAYSGHDITQVICIRPFVTGFFHSA